MRFLPIFLSLCLNIVNANQKPNILFIAVDDLRPVLGCYGDTQAVTPNIDQFARQAIQFQQAYCMIAVCGASRANLMTGIHPTNKRYVTFVSEVDQDTPGVKTLPQVFKDQGYTTISNGKIFHNPRDTEKRSWSEPAWQPKAKGLGSFDPTTTEHLSKRKRGRIYEFPEVEDHRYYDGEAAQKTIADLKRLSESSKPFFLACGFKRPHLPFYAPKKYWDLYDRSKLKVANNLFHPKGAPEELRGSGEFKSYHLANYDINSPEWHRMMVHGYYACVSYIDQLVGNILDELKQLKLDQNTIVVFWGDHGFHLGEHNFWGKHNTMLPSLRIPMFIKVPGLEGKVLNDFVETADIFPSLCELSGITIPKSVHGKSFVPYIKSEQSSFRDHAYGRFKNGDAIVTHEFSYTKYNNGPEMLYHLEKDPDENTNLASKPEYQTSLNQMRGLLNNRMQQAKNYQH